MLIDDWPDKLLAFIHCWYITKPEKCPQFSHSHSRDSDLSHGKYATLDESPEADCLSCLITTRSSRKRISALSIPSVQQQSGKMAALNGPIFNPTRRCEAAQQACLLGTVNPGSNYTGSVGTPLLREPHPTDRYVGPAIRRPSGVDDRHLPRAVCGVAARLVGIYTL